MAAGAMWVTFDAAVKGPPIWSPGEEAPPPGRDGIGAGAEQQQEPEPERELGAEDGAVPSMLQLVVVGDGGAPGFGGRPWFPAAGGVQALSKPDWSYLHRKPLTL